MKEFRLLSINNSFRYIILSVLFLNIILLNYFNVPDFDQVLNLLLSYGIFSYYQNIKFQSDNNINTLQIILALLLFLVTLYRSFWLHNQDYFIYLFSPLLFTSSALFFNNIKKIFKNFKPLLMSSLLPISKLIFIPVAIILNPFSTFFTWLTLNALGFSSVMKGQEIFYNNAAISVTFSCSGAGQIIFSIIAMIIFNFCFPLKNAKFLLIQLCRTFLFTFIANIIRLFLLAIYGKSANSDSFSIFDYLHGGNGGLLFSFFSMMICCESYKRLYLKDTKN